MNKKGGTGKLVGLKKLWKVAEVHEDKAMNDQEELELMISAMKAKIETFK